MYKCSAKAEIVDAVDMCTNLMFQIVLKENMPFKIGECFLL